MTECTNCGDYLGFDELPPQSGTGLCDYCTGAADERERIAAWLEEGAEAYHAASDQMVYPHGETRIGNVLLIKATRIRNGEHSTRKGEENNE